MFGLRHKPTENELESCIVYAAYSAWAKQQYLGEHVHGSEITSALQAIFKRKGINPSIYQNQAACISVLSLIRNEQLMKEAESSLFMYIVYQAAIPNDIIKKMHEIIKSSAQDNVANKFGVTQERMNTSENRLSQNQPPSELPKSVTFLYTYLACGTVTISLESLSKVERSALQVFILGMTDMLRQTEDLSWSQFIDLYKDLLTKYKLSPSTPIENFIGKIENSTSKNKDVEAILKEGAESIRRFLVERDAEAPIDLMRAKLFASKNPSSFSELNGV